ncbi:hypothetical protein B0H16DRAFT_1456107 [Mycena metata]|uniref:Uncharacterized protein n=1 Tax=Mycena metata TaxID=1033252 RepID=A0AAD7JFF4_9AGAR|nr:hypothetical protein B0H16DRAFT_1456107 [Mycena metata]
MDSMAFDPEEEREMRQDPDVELEADGCVRQHMCDVTLLPPYEGGNRWRGAAMLVPPPHQGAARARQGRHFHRARMRGTLSPCLTRSIFCVSPALLSVGAARRASSVGCQNAEPAGGARCASARKVVYLKTSYSKLRTYMGRYGLGRWKGRRKGGCRGGERRRGEDERERVWDTEPCAHCARKQNLQRWARGLDLRGLDAQATTACAQASAAAPPPSRVGGVCTRLDGARGRRCLAVTAAYTTAGNGTSIPQRPPPGTAGSDQMDGSKVKGAGQEKTRKLTDEGEKTTHLAGSRQKKTPRPGLGNNTAQLKLMRTVSASRLQTLPRFRSF